jgi:two-component system, OmpR family, sensor histidine kinase CiaH
VKFPFHRAVSNRRLRSLSFRVAIRATLIALVGGVVVCAIADIVVANRISAGIDARINSELALLVRESPRQLLSASTSKSQVSSDPDDVPILAWLIPKGSQRVVTLNVNSPRLPARYEHVGSLRGGSLRGLAVRLEGRAGTSGFLVVGMSTGQIGSVLATLLVIQGVLAPLALLGLFFAATLIGRRAAAPIEQARLRQLEFTADASHELRTPLSVIEAEVSLALGAPRSVEEYRGTLERVANESERLRRIVQDLLWLARLDALPDGPAHQPVDVTTVAESCVERFRGVAAQRGISLSLTSVTGRAAMVVAPSEWLDQLIGVLLDNACRHAREGGRVEVRVGASEEEVSLRVDDDGPGFDKQGRELVLQRFHRASDDPGGTGLGLAIAQAVVAATQGAISLSDAELGGASVVVVWPRFHGRTGSEFSRSRGG